MASPDALPARTMLDVVVLTRPGCMHTALMCARLDEALRRLPGAPTYALTDLTTLPEADPRRGYPTPTVLVRGRDLFDLPQPPRGRTPT